MCVAEPDDDIDIGLMPFCSQRIPQKDDQVDLIVLDLGPDLLHAAQMSGQHLMDLEIGDLFNQSSCRTGRAYLVLCQDPSVCDAKILHQFFLSIMCN